MSRSNNYWLQSENMVDKLKEQQAGSVAGEK